MDLGVIYFKFMQTYIDQHSYNNIYIVHYFVIRRGTSQPVPGVQKSSDGQRSLDDHGHLEDSLQNYLVCIELSL